MMWGSIHNAAICLVSPSFVVGLFVTPIQLIQSMCYNSCLSLIMHHMISGISLDTHVVSSYWYLEGYIKTLDDYYIVAIVAILPL